MQRRFPQFALLKAQLIFANPDWRPIIAQWDQINVDFLGKAIYAAITKNEDSKEALMGVMPSVRKIMMDGGYLLGSR
jgi:multiple sugar transport system substrate-binding protein